ncbi:MAG: SCP2 sterol-binding domain-containing protein [Verrucomicrobiota bacterium]
MKTRVSFLAAAIATALCSSVFAATTAEPDNVTPQDVFDGMRQNFHAEKAKGLHARYQWELSGPNGGQWWLEINDGKFKMDRGKIDNPNVTFIASDQTWVALSNGKLKGTWAFMTGRLKVRGSQAVARKLDEIFP